VQKKVSTRPSAKRPPKPDRLTIQEAVQKKIKQLSQTRRGRECTQELDVLMDQLRDMLPDEQLDPKAEQRDAELAEGFWKDVRAQLQVKEEEIYGGKPEPWGVYKP